MVFEERKKASFLKAKPKQKRRRKGKKRKRKKRGKVVEKEKRRKRKIKGKEEKRREKMSSGRTVSMPVFNGKEDAWAWWSMQFMAFLRLKGCDSAVKGRDPNLPSREDEDISGAGGVKKRNALEKNETAVAYLILAIDDSSLAQHIKRGKTAEYPNGLAYLIWKELCNKYEPKDGLSMVEMVIKMAKLEMNGKPDDYFAQMERIEAKCTVVGNELDERVKIAFAMMAAKEEYNGVIAAEQRNKGEKMTLRDLQDALGDIHRISEQKKGRSDDTEDEEKEVGLAALGKKKCHHCGKKGHIQSECWNLHPNLMPEWMKKKIAGRSEAAGVAVDYEDRGEMLLL